MHAIKIGNNVRVARVEMGWTQEQLAERVGVTRQTIGLIENDKYNPTIKLCLKLAQVTGKRLDELFWIAAEEEKDNQHELR
jgi:putative transcriptional regulator